MPAPAPGGDGPKGGNEDSTAAPDHSDTNSQVEGVMEGDILKTDGKFIYYYSNNYDYINNNYKNEITITSVSGADMKVVSRIQAGDSHISEMYITKDTLVTVGSRYEYFKAYKDANIAIDTAVDAAVDTAAVAPVPPPEGDYPYCSWFRVRSFTEYKVYDISNRANPVERRTLEIEGSPVATRMIGDSLYFVCTKYIEKLPKNIVADGDILPIIRDTTLKDGYSTVPANEIFYFPDSKDCIYMFAGVMDTASVVPVSMESYIGSGGNIYMSLENLYIVRENWDIRMYSFSEIYRFGVAPTGVKFMARGFVPGRILNQYAMDEHNGAFRVATTVWKSDGQTNGVYALDVAKMAVIGKVENLALGEDIRSVRFMGDTAYMVTFRQIDPLFVIDMSNPRAPQIMGELKIPGFSTYLHPAGGGLLFGIGRDVDETTNRDVGLKVSLFDASDPRNPKQLDSITFANSYSEASYNPRAIMVDKDRNIFGFIVTSGSETFYYIAAVQSGRLASLAAETVDSGNYHYNSRLCYSGDTLYYVYGSGIKAYNYAIFKFINEILF
jgi:uncharacterized secreted protein with C-terminal beta-propeller domain